MIKHKIEEIFNRYFGRTPLKERLNDILGEAIELSRYTDIRNLKEETGDLLCSIIQLCNENGWDPIELMEQTLIKIDKRGSQYMSLGRKIKVAILGGAFDPIHNGHIEVAQAVLNYSKSFDEVHLMPCFKHAYGKNMASAIDRVTMCNIAAIVDGRIKVSEFEITNQFSGETYHLVKSLMELESSKDTYDYSMIMGQDNANTFDKWFNYELLEQMIRFVIVPRSGSNLDPKILWYLKQPHIFLCPDKPIVNISSSQIRHNITNPEWTGFLNPDVLEYIKKKGLYGFQNK